MNSKGVISLHQKRAVVRAEGHSVTSLLMVEAP